MKVTFLGTGTSCGVPLPTCTCEVCTSSDPHDNRLRASVLVETDHGEQILIDCGPDFRQQALRAGIRHLDALLLTHGHFDHCYGIDDLRAYAYAQPLPVYADQILTEQLKAHWNYIFVQRYPGAPQLELHTLTHSSRFHIGQTECVPIRIFHGKLPIFAYRIGRFAYVTDCTEIKEEEWKKLEGIETLVVDALRWKEHPTHWCVAEALEAVRRLQPRQTYFTHMGHDIGLHNQANARLPEGVQLAYDGLVIEC